MRPLYSLILLCLFLLPALSQNLPSKIRGYSVHSQAIVVNQQTPSSRSGPAVELKVGDPVVVDVSLSGISLELSAEVTSAAQSARVDFLTFHDVRVNGVSVVVEEYTHRFSVRKNEAITLPQPAKIFLPTGALLKGALAEMHESRKEWLVTGRVFVFGKFRKYGFYHKRVVPVDVKLTIKNPLLNDPA